MQYQVAEKMKTYIAARKANNPNSKLLFVLAGGDNFYWNGASTGRFTSTWRQVYGEELAGVPWFAVMGNHDYGNDDPGTACPDVNPRFTCDSSNANTAACGGAKPYSTKTQGYNSNALDANKGGVDGALRANWIAPDFMFWYSIPALDFEIVAMDWNAYQMNALGGNGFCSTCGAGKLKDVCGSQQKLESAMWAKKDASTEIINNRSATAASKNVAILSHYPAYFQNNINLRHTYVENMPADKQDSTKVFNFYGHTHLEQCEGRSDSGECLDFLTGGSGGCCGTGDTPAGFVAIAWDSTKTQVVECFQTGECTLNHFALQGGVGLDNKDEVCAKTTGDPRCDNYIGPNTSFAAPADQLNFKG
jgi:hypothetical protein